MERFILGLSFVIIADHVTSYFSVVEGVEEYLTGVII